jgi:AcrR family transcriptional regulator
MSAEEPEMLDQLTVRGRLVAAAMRLAAQGSWRQVTLADIAQAAGVSLVDLRHEFDSKGELLAAIVGMVDDAVLARVPQRSGAQEPRDALFEVVMSRFDVLSGYKTALKSIAASWPAEASYLRALTQSQAWMLRAAGVRSEGIEGQVRAAGLTAVYASVFRTWLDDDDAGLAKTMAALDRRLRRGEEALKTVDGAISRLCCFVERCCRGQRATDEAPKAPPSASEAPPSPTA